MIRLRAPESVSMRLTLWNIGVFALVLLALGAISHHVLRLNLVAAVDRQMAGRTQSLIRRWERISTPGRATDPMHHVDRGGARPGVSPVGWVVAPTPGECATALGVSPGTPAAPAPANPFDDDNNTPPKRIYHSKILTPAWRDYFGGSADTPWDERAFTYAVWGHTIRSTVVVDGDPVRVLSIPLYRDGRVQAVAQMVRPLGEVTDALAASNRTLLMLLPVALLVSGVFGAFLTGRALQPVRTLRRAAEGVQAQSLSLRLPTPGRDEFSELAGTINDVLNRLEKAFRQQARFTADASHELRTPLTVMRGNLSLALARPRSAEEYRDTLQRAHRATERMGRLVENLLLLARADAAQLALDREPLSLHDVIATAVESLPQRQVRVAGLGADVPLTVRGNGALLVTLFTNLLNNANRYTPPEGTITLRTSRAGHVASVTVEDTGEGIAAEHLPHLSERFYRADPSRCSESGGTGLGLAICRSIAEAHGGALRIRSELGKGTAVTVSLPLA